MSQGHETAMKDVFEHDEVADVLRSTFYSKPTTPKKVAPGRRASKPKPDHYEVICISMYREDLDALDAKVADLKARGHRKMSRSSLIRYALENVDLTKLPRSY